MGLIGSGFNEENHVVSGSWIAWLIDDSIGTILSVPFRPYHFFLEPILPYTKLHVQYISTWRATMLFLRFRGRFLLLCL